MKKYFFDVEFNETTTSLKNGKKLSHPDFISIGIVSEDGREYYGVSNEFNLAATKKDEWMTENVISKLPPEKERKSKAEIGREIMEFIGKEKARFYFWVAAQDAAILSDLLSPSFLQRPRNVAEVIHNLGQTYEMMGCPDRAVPDRPAPEQQHNALADARWLKQFHDNLQEHHEKYKGKLNFSL